MTTVPTFEDLEEYWRKNNGSESFSQSLERALSKAKGYLGVKSIKEVTDTLFDEKTSDKIQEILNNEEENKQVSPKNLEKVDIPTLDESSIAQDIANEDFYAEDDILSNQGNIETVTFTIPETEKVVEIKSQDIIVPKDWDKVLIQKTMNEEEIFILPAGTGIDLNDSRIYRKPKLQEPNFILPDKEYYISVNSPSIPNSIRKAIRGFNVNSKVPRNILDFVDQFKKLDGIYVPTKNIIIHKVESRPEDDDIVVSILSNTEEETEEDKSSVKVIDERFSSDIGKRDENEDSHILGESKIGKERIKIWGIFDGHGGDAVAKYIEENYLKKFEEYFRDQPIVKLVNESDLSKESKGFEEEFKSAIIDFHINFDWDIIKNVNDESGATATLLFQIGNYLILVNAGDSRTVLYGKQSFPQDTSGIYQKKKNNQREVIIETIDHKPDDEGEKKRIEKTGSLISEGRVWGKDIGLSVSRGFGDREFKKNSIKTLKQSPVSPEPDVFFHFMHPGEKVEVILGCDGVWDVVESSEGMNIIEKVKKDIPRAIKEIIKLGSTDNISIIYLKLECS